MKVEVRADAQLFSAPTLLASRSKVVLVVVPAVASHRLALERLVGWIPADGAVHVR